MTAQQCIHDFETAEEFLNAIRRSNDTWWPDGSRTSPWVFRGIGDAISWKLVPSAWRSAGNSLRPLIDHIASLGLMVPHEYSASEVHQKLCFWESAESEALYRFAELANASGFKVPTGAFQSNRSPINVGRLHSFKEQEYWNSGLGEVAPLAQHHGIPTRLLDWTNNPLVAAYFATVPMSRPSGDAPICIWALNTDAVMRPGMITPTFSGMTLLVHNPQRSENAYLHSQGGVLTELVGASGYFVNNACTWPALEEILTPVDGSPVLLGHRLRGAEVPRLQALLEREGIHGAMLMPSLDNVAKTVLARWPA